MLTYIGKAFKARLPTRIIAGPITTLKAADYYSRLPRKRRPRRRRRRLGLPAKKKGDFENTFAFTLYKAFYGRIDEAYRTFPPISGHSKSCEYSNSAGFRLNLPNKLSGNEVTPWGCLTSLLIPERLKMFLTINAEILAHSLANFYRQ